MGGMDQILVRMAWVPWVHNILVWVTWVVWVEILAWVAWVKILAWVQWVSGVLLKRYYQKFRKIYRKAPVLKSLAK